MDGIANPKQEGVVLTEMQKKNTYPGKINGWL